MKKLFTVILSILALSIVLNSCIERIDKNTAPVDKGTANEVDSTIISADTTSAETATDSQSSTEETKAEISEVSTDIPAAVTTVEKYETVSPPVSAANGSVGNGSGESGNSGNVSESISNVTEPESDYDPIPVGQDKLHQYRLSNDMGNSRFLKGKVVVYCYFVDDDESRWSAEGCENFSTRQIKPALDFIVREAKKWNVDISFDLRCYCNETAPFSLKYNGIVNKDLKVGGSTKDILEQIAVNMGYSSECDFVTEENKRNGCDSAFVTLLNKNGCSYARNVYSKGGDYHANSNNPEHCVIFSRDYNYNFAYQFEKMRSKTIAHEILHLFGAEDYYGEKRLPLANQYYYYDIMTCNSSDIDQLYISDMTAFCLGWTDNVPELCYNKTWADGLLT